MTVTSIAQGCFDVTKGLRKCQGVGVYFLLCLLSYQRALVIHMPSAASKRDTQPGKIKISHISRLFVQIKRIITNIILGDSRIYATDCISWKLLLLQDRASVPSEDAALMAAHKKPQVHHPEIFVLVSSTESWEGKGNTNDPTPPHYSLIPLLSLYAHRHCRNPKEQSCSGSHLPGNWNWV